MNLKSRMKKLEQEYGGTGAEVTIFETLYEDENGHVNEDESSAMAIIVWGPGRSKVLNRSREESFAEFNTRANRLRQISWEKATKTR